ncbi:MAG: DUF2634 domain-containing protein, partial [Candidatus Thorarchaeota archaeon]
MSRELKLVNGDINIVNGSIKTLDKEDKLKQQISKIVITTKGSKYHPSYGTDIYDNIGRYELNINFLTPLLKNDIEEGIEYYQNIQKTQEILQEMDDEEILMYMIDFNVERLNQT